MITQFKDIGYTVNMTFGKQNDCYVEFQAFEILAGEDDGKPRYWKKGEMSSFPGTTNIEEAEYQIKGYIKWDGCANVDFNNSVHICGPTEAKNLASLITRLHDLAYNMLPSADEGCFEK